MLSVISVVVVPAPGAILASLTQGLGGGQGELNGAPGRTGDAPWSRVVGTRWPCPPAASFLLVSHGCPAFPWGALSPQLWVWALDGGAFFPKQLRLHICPFL